MEGISPPQNNNKNDNNSSLGPSDLMDSNTLMKSLKLELAEDEKERESGPFGGGMKATGHGEVIDDVEQKGYHITSKDIDIEEKFMSEDMLNNKKSDGNNKNPPIKLTQEDLESVAVLYGAIKGVKGSLDKTMLNKMSSTFDFHVGNVISKLNERLSELEGKNSLFMFILFFGSFPTYSLSISIYVYKVFIIKKNYICTTLFLIVLKTSNNFFRYHIILTSTYI